MERQLPPEFLQAMGQQQPVQPEPAIPPAPEYGMALAGGNPQPPIPPAPENGMALSQLGEVGSGMGVTDNAPPIPPPGFDPVLDQLSQTMAGMGKKRRTPKIPRPDIGYIQSIAADDQRFWQRRNDRISRDVMLYRQHDSARPHGFKRSEDIPFVSPALSFLVNKLANMLSAPEPRFIVPFHDEQTKGDSQVIEDLGYWWRRYERKCYSRSGGADLQWDEFWYLLLSGSICARIVPDPEDEQYPWSFHLLDPSTCFPSFKGKYGMTRMTRQYTATALDIVSTYGMGNEKRERQLIDKMGYEWESFGDSYTQEGNVVEYWDTQYRAVLWNGVTIMDVTRHGLDMVPFVYVVAKGEPRGFGTPETSTSNYVDEYGNTGYSPGRDDDQAEKGVSVFHHLINTNRIAEVIHTLLLMEIEKAIRPPTITYVAPQYQGQDPEPISTRKGANNQRILNYMKVEAVPTSPRPTDMAPVLNKVMSDIAEGGLPPMMHGNESGSNVSGFAVESLIAMAKDAILPYVKGYENYLSQCLEMLLHQYQTTIAPFRTIQVPASGNYGMTPMTELTLELVQRVGVDVDAKLYVMSQQMLPQQIQAAAMAVQAGLWSSRKGMEHIGSTDPDRDFRDIITERAIQHPEIMENFMIPMAFAAQGNQQMAELWVTMVLMPKMMQAMGGMPPPGAAPIGAGGEGNPPPEPNGQSNPVMNEETPPPGGPSAGQGRGPAPE